MSKPCRDCNGRPGFDAIMLEPLLVEGTFSLKPVS